MKHLLNTCKKSLYWKWADFEISHAYMFGKTLVCHCFSGNGKVAIFVVLNPSTKYKLIKPYMVCPLCGEETIHNC